MYYHPTHAHESLSSTACTDDIPRYHVTYTHTHTHTHAARLTRPQTRALCHCFFPQYFSIFNVFSATNPLPPSVDDHYVENGKRREAKRIRC